METNRNSIRSSLVRILLLGAMSLCAAGVQAQLALEDCGALSNAYGPYDYTNPVHRRDNLPIVEQHHFNSDVRSLRRGMTAETPLGDLAYTLRAFPNHHLALDAMARYHRRHGTQKFPSGQYSILCWFDRARRFSPRDGSVRLLHGIHLIQTADLVGAEQELLQALHLMPDSAEVNYNLGLMYLRQEKYAEARDFARRAYDLGYPLPGLRDQLRAAGEWED